MENNIELQEMREQLASFKQQLAGQKIINDKLMRKAMAEKVGRITRLRNSYLIICIAGLLFAVPMFYFRGFPLYFILYVLFLFIFDGLMTYSYHVKVNKSDLMNGDMKNVVTELKTLRKKYQQWYWIGVPEIIIFLVLFYYSLIHLDVAIEFIRASLIGSSIGIVIGGIIGISMNNKVIGLCDEIISDLESD